MLALVALLAVPAPSIVGAASGFVTRYANLQQMFICGQRLREKFKFEG